MKSLLLAAAVAALPLLGTTSAKAAAILFDPDGGGPSGSLSIGSFTFNPGNSRATGLTPTGIPGVSTFTDYYEATVSSFNDPNGTSIGGTNLNVTYEYTIILRTPGIATTTINGATGLPQTTFSTGSGPSLLQVFFDPARNANNLAGTGFNDGTMVLSANVTSLSGNFNIDSLTPQTLDQSPNGNQWGAQQTVSGNGGFSVNAAISFFDPTFFTNPPTQQINFVFANGNTKLPYNQVDPAMAFFDGTSSNVGAVNGVNGPDILIQTVGTASFGIVPTPEVASAGMALTGLFGLGRLLRRRRA
jgi:hypothetical protein